MLFFISSFGVALILFKPGVDWITTLVAQLSTSLIWKRWFSGRTGLGLSFKNSWRLANETMTIVRLSKDRSIAAYLIMASAMAPLTWCTVLGVYVACLTSFDLIELMLSQHASSTCWLVSLSKMPSQPNTMKSWNSSFTVNYEISGWAIITPSLPPYLGCLASMSPKVRETESLPGITRCGPKMNYCYGFPSLSKTF